MNHQFQVTGMSCGHCVKAVERAVQTLDAQAQISVDLPSGRVNVDSMREREALEAAITHAGYSVQ